MPRPEKPCLPLRPKLRIARCGSSISEEIEALARRGVKVRIITDDEQMKSSGSDVEWLSKVPNILVRHDGDAESFMHNKFAIVDGCTLLNGSFNWTQSAVLRHRENLVITENAPSLVRSFANEFDRLWAVFQGNTQLPPAQQEATDEEGGGWAAGDWEARMGLGRAERVAGTKHEPGRRQAMAGGSSTMSSTTQEGRLLLSGGNTCCVVCVFLRGPRHERPLSIRPGTRIAFTPSPITNGATF